MGFFDKLKGAFSQKEEEEEVAPQKVYEGNFFTVARTGSEADVRSALEQGASVFIKNDEHCTPLMFAAEENTDPGVIKALVEAGAILEYPTKGGATPLMGAAQKNKNPLVLQALIDARAQVNKINDIGFTPLIYAAAYNPNPEFTFRLIKAGANVNFANKFSRSVFIYAALNTTNVEILRILLDNGANPKQRDLNQLTAFEIIKKEGKISQDSEIYKLLQEVDEKGWTKR